METEQAQFVQQGMRPRTPETWIGRLSLHNFRNYAHASLVTEPRPVVLVGHNGAGKTNILEAVSMVSPGRGLRRAAPADLTCAGAEADRLGNSPAWSISAKLHTKDDAFTIGTGLALTSQSSASASRVVRIDGEQQRSANVLADYVEMSWLTPASDGLFTGAASDRRRFLDRLVLCFDPQHGTRSNRFDRAMRQRNKLLDLGARSDAEFAGLEDVLAETGADLQAYALPRGHVHDCRLVVGGRRLQRLTQACPASRVPTIRPDPLTRMEMGFHRAYPAVAL
ncbi:MAG: AAA family ATPase [Pseudomonadota bacterium]